MTKKPDIPKRSIKPAAFLGNGNGYSLRSPLAGELHHLVCAVALDACTDDAAVEAYDNLTRFLESKASREPGILLEESINKCSHFVDVLHLPFSENVECDPELRSAKARVMFDTLSQFCRQQAEHNAVGGNTDAGAITWDKYAYLMTHPNRSNFTPLLQAIHSGDMGLYNDVAHELSDLRRRHVLTDKAYADQFTTESISHYHPLMMAADSGNKEMYNHVASELYRLHHRHTIDDATYARQFLKPAKVCVSPLFFAIKCDHDGIYRSLTGKLKKLHKQKLIDDETYAQQFTQPLGLGFTPLQEVIFSGNADLFTLFVGDLKDVLKATSKTRDEYLSKFQAQLETHSHENWNVFHCATMANGKRNAPNPLLVKALLDEFHEAFGDKARGRIERLYKEQTRTTQYRPAFHDQHPEWLQKLLSLSETDPVRPSPRHR